MKAKFDTILGALGIAALALSCSTPKYASAQSSDDYYYNQPDPSMQDNQFDDQGADVDEQQDVDFNAFYNALSPYGTWENDPEYGQVWVSNQPGFVPYYTDGNWAYSDAGWVWVSNYSWGWAPFHYGRWAFRGHWLWVPGYEWAPAWVSWRTGGDYYGWAPLAPGISIGVNIGFGGYMPADRWNFCPRAYITSGHFNQYCIDRSRNVTVIHNTTIINRVNMYHNARFVAGPDRRDVERYTRTRVTAMPIHNVRTPGTTVINRGSIQMYRPAVRPAGNLRQTVQHTDVNRPGSYNNNRSNINHNNQQPVQQQPRYQPGQNRPGNVQPQRPVNQRPANQQQPARQAVHNTNRQQNGFQRGNTPVNIVPNRQVTFRNRVQETGGQPQQQVSRQQTRQQPRPAQSRPSSSNAHRRP
ncbi:MAG TPA: DUF6600 domain-containing protein [Chitinophagaceae bacterium]|nr:DUF6600 domain-containing protein [Chitinophagaceae bacterium]